jgi:hypothetical protein
VSPDDDVACDDATADDDLSADDDAAGPVGTDRCPQACPVPKICQPCDDGACAAADVECNDDGSCGEISWVCGSESPGCDVPGRTYVGNSPEDCALIDFGCPDGQEGFEDECGCGCVTAPMSDDCDVPGRRYVADSPDQCAVIRYACEAGETAFSDECGCGCIEATSDECADVERSLRNEWSTLAECSEDADCTVRYNALCGASTETLGDVGCYLPVNENADDADLEALEARAVECGLLVADCDCASPPPAACVDGSCMPQADAALCEDTGGTWDEGSCGHYSCGRAPDCDALIPGCDCGPVANFVQSAGCSRDPECGLD